MDVQLWQWVTFGVAVLALLAVDLVVSQRAPAGRGLRWPLLLSAVWLVVGVGFAGLVWVWAGDRPAGEYLTGYLIERTLSIDNVFVLVLLFRALGVPARLRGFAVTWGIVLALVLRGFMIAAGASLLDAVHWVAYLFAAFLIGTGLRMARGHALEVHPERSRLLAAARRILPMSDGYTGGRLLVRDGRRLLVTPMVVVMLAVATTDVVFAVDSVPSIFAVTRDTFLVVAANALALVGLRPLYELLAGMVDRFRYLNLGLGAVLVVVGTKMALADVYEPPAGVTLGVVSAIVAAAIVASLRSATPPSLPSPKGPIDVPHA